MRRVVIPLLFLTVLAELALGQTRVGQDSVREIAGVRHATWKAGELTPAGRPDSGSLLWDNMAIWAWWSGPKTNYINLDWGKLPDPASGLRDHVIDGFTFSYGTNNWDPIGESFAISFFDSCTGWGNLGIQEAGLFFSGLPNCYGMSTTLPPGYGWVWSITVDLESTGYEFLLNQDFGIGLCRTSTPLMGGSGPGVGCAPNTNGNGPTGTENAFDIYLPNLTYNGSWYFGAYPNWATWKGALYGTEGDAGMTFYGVGAKGNDAGLLATGGFLPGGSLRFLLRRNQLPLDGHLLASQRPANRYIGGAWDVTRLVGPLTYGMPLAMTPDPLGDFCVADVDVPVQHGGLTVFFQGLLCGPPPLQPPVDASNGMRAN